MPVRRIRVYNVTILLGSLWMGAIKLSLTETSKTSLELGTESP